LVQTPEANLSRAMQWLNVSDVAIKRFEEKATKNKQLTALKKKGKLFL